MATTIEPIPAGMMAIGPKKRLEVMETAPTATNSFRDRAGELTTVG